MPVDAFVHGSSNRVGRWARRFSIWVHRVGALRATLLATACASLASLGLTWLSLRMLGFYDMGNALWISLLVPVPLAFACSGLNFYLVVALEQARRQIHALAMVDALTGLGNRHRFMPAAQRELDLAQRHQQPLALLLLDVDYFKSVNDQFGHAVGDDVLVEVGRRCQLALRATDLLARWGGEEFIMLLPNTPVAQAQQLAERVRAAVSASDQKLVQGLPVRVTVSVGAAGTAAGQALTLDALVQRADRALYHAKHAGRDRVSVSSPEYAPATLSTAASEQDATAGF